MKRRTAACSATNKHKDPISAAALICLKWLMGDGMEKCLLCIDIYEIDFQKSVCGDRFLVICSDFTHTSAFLFYSRAAIIDHILCWFVNNVHHVPKEHKSNLSQFLSNQRSVEDGCMTAAKIAVIDTEIVIIYHNYSLILVQRITSCTVTERWRCLHRMARVARAILFTASDLLRISQNKLTFSLLIIHPLTVA